MKPQFQITNSIGNVLTINNTFGYGVQTYLQTDEQIGSTSLLVDNNTGFPVSGLIMLGALGGENTDFEVSFTGEFGSNLTASRMNINYIIE